MRPTMVKVTKDANTYWLLDKTICAEIVNHYVLKNLRVQTRETEHMISV